MYVWETCFSEFLFGQITTCTFFDQSTFGAPFNAALIFGSQFIGHFISDKAKKEKGDRGGGKGNEEQRSKGAKDVRHPLKNNGVAGTQKGQEPASRVCSLCVVCLSLCMCVYLCDVGAFSMCASRYATLSRKQKPKQKQRQQQKLKSKQLRQHSEEQLRRLQLCCSTVRCPVLK